MSTRRKCPVCGYIDGTYKKMHILAVLNDATGSKLIAKCGCPFCGTVWNETYWRKTGEIQNVQVH